MSCEGELVGICPPGVSWLVSHQVLDVAGAPLQLGSLGIYPRRRNGIHREAEPEIPGPGLMKIGPHLLIAVIKRRTQMLNDRVRNSTSADARTRSTAASSQG